MEERIQPEISFWSSNSLLTNYKSIAVFLLIGHLFWHWKIPTGENESDDAWKSARVGNFVLVARKLYYLRTNVLQLIWHWTSHPVRAVRTRRPWQVVLTMVACLLRRALPLDRTHGGLSTSEHLPTSTASPLPTTATITSVIIAEFTVFVKYLITGNTSKHIGLQYVISENLMEH